MRRPLSTELQCALFASCVFVLFFTSSLYSAARADVFQWDDDPGQSYPGVAEDPACPVYTNDVIMPAPDDEEPEAGGPCSSGEPVVQRSATPSWIRQIAEWVESLLGYLLFRL